MPTPERKPRPTRRIKNAAAKMIESIRDAYDPDADFRVGNVESLANKFWKTLVEAGKDKKLPDLVHKARIIEVNRFGAFRIRTIESSDDMRAALKKADDNRRVLERLVDTGVRLQEASKFSEEQKAALHKISETQKFKEDWFGSDYNGKGNPFDEYIPLIGGPFSHQLYLHDFLDMLAKSFEAWNHNPIAHQVVKITTYFVLGRGITYKAKDPNVQKAFAAWWDSIDMGERLEFWSDMLTRDGELMIRHFINPMTKQMFVRWVDPSTVWEIVTDLEDIETVFYYHQQYPTAFQVLYGVGTDKKFDPTKFGSSKYVINQIPADEIHHIKVNCSPNEKRGRSDLFPVLGWLKRWKDFQTSVVLRAIGQASFSWKNKLVGNQTDVDAFISEFGCEPPEFGSVHVENDSSNLEPMAVNFSAGAVLPDCPGVVNAISVGTGVPAQYLGNAEHATRATAVVASEPGVKKFQARQLLLGRLLKDLAQDWASNELANDSLPKMVPGDDEDLPVVMRWLKAKGSVIPGALAVLSFIQKMTGTNMVAIDTGIEFQFPEIAVEDRTAKLGDIETSQQAGYISKRRAATMVAKELGIEDFDYDDEQDEIADESKDSISGMYPPGQGGDLTSKVNDALGKPPLAAPATPPPAPPRPIGPSGSGLPSATRRDVKQQDGR